MVPYVGSGWIVASSLHKSEIRCSTLKELVAVVFIPRSQKVKALVESEVKVAEVARSLWALKRMEGAAKPKLIVVV